MTEQLCIYNSELQKAWRKRKIAYKWKKVLEKDIEVDNTPRWYQDPDWGFDRQAKKIKISSGELRRFWDNKDISSQSYGKIHKYVFFKVIEWTRITSESTQKP